MAVSDVFGKDCRWLNKGNKYKKKRLENFNENMIKRNQGNALFLYHLKISP